MYQTRGSVRIPKAGADGCYHTMAIQRKAKPENQRKDRFLWNECCEYCPYSDCVCTNSRSCLVDITYSEFVEFVDYIVEVLDNGGTYHQVYQAVNIRDKELHKFVDIRAYPSRSAQKKIKIFLEKRRMENDKK